jgi:hypothetical protein
VLETYSGLRLLGPALVLGAGPCLCVCGRTSFPSVLLLPCSVSTFFSRSCSSLRRATLEFCSDSSRSPGEGGGGGGGSTRHARQGQDDEQPTTIQKACSQAPKDIFPRSAVLTCHGCRGQIRSLTSLCCSTLSCAARWGQSACCAVAW